MSDRLAMLTLVVALSFYVVHGPRAAAIAPQLEWAGLQGGAAQSESLPSIGAAGNGTVGVENRTGAAAPSIATLSHGGLAPLVTPTSGYDAAYEAQREDCESLPSDARNHCIEYVKFRCGRF